MTRGFKKRRTIYGIPVQVRAEPNGTGVTPENFLVSIKHPDGEIHLEYTAFYYWQAFNYATTLLTQPK